MSMSCPFLGVEMTDSSNETNVAWFLGHTHKTHISPAITFKRNFGSLFRPLFKVQAHPGTIFVLLLTQQAGHEFGSNLMHVHIVC